METSKFDHDWGFSYSHYRTSPMLYGKYIAMSQNTDVCRICGLHKTKIYDLNTKQDIVFFKFAIRYNLTITENNISCHDLKMIRLLA